MSTTKNNRPTTTNSVIYDTDDTKIYLDNNNDNDIIKIEDEDNLKLNYLIDNVNKYSKYLKKVYINNNNLSESFDRLKEIDKEKKIEILWDYLISNYKNNYEYLLNNYDKIKSKNMKLLDNKNKLKKMKKQSSLLKQKISTKEKIYKLNFNRYNEMIFETNLLKDFMIYLMVLLIIPILRLANIMNKTLSIISYLGLLLIGISYTLYMFFSDRENRDNIFYNRFNFEKPDKINDES